MLALMLSYAARQWMKESTYGFAFRSVTASSSILQRYSRWDEGAEPFLL